MKDRVKRHNRLRLKTDQKNSWAIIPHSASLQLSTLQACDLGHSGWDSLSVLSLVLDWIWFANGRWSARCFSAICFNSGSPAPSPCPGLQPPAQAPNPRVSVPDPDPGPCHLPPGPEPQALDPTPGAPISWSGRRNLLWGSCLGSWVD